MKKFVSVFLCFIILFGFSACTEEARPDMTALSERLALINEYYAFDYFDAVIYDGAYHVYFSLCSENDVLLSLHTDEAGNIDDVTITAVAEKMKTDGERNAYMNFSSAVIDSFTSLSEKDVKEKEKSLSYRKPGLYFSDLYETYSALRYNFVFSSNSEYISLYCEYTEIMEVTDKQ
ncbi:MAG: hypothetical protein J6Q94_08350 [Clostridia bacterium]|nr:hypothetical protein [Clostridia bacterium]